MEDPRVDHDLESWLRGETEDVLEDRSAVDTAALLVGAIAHALHKAGPETTVHLAKAGQELMLAVRSFVRHFAEAMTEAPDSEPPPSLEKVEISGAPPPARADAPKGTGAAGPKATGPGAPKGTSARGAPAKAKAKAKGTTKKKT
ncbi:MAG TPA: hypothetical protein VM840_07505 [Actinomycetota bacterium]|nr:hypothetical protein [Actinomycetota bacterium]